MNSPAGETANTRRAAATNLSCSPLAALPATTLTLRANQEPSSLKAPRLTLFPWRPCLIYVTLNKVGNSEPEGFSTAEQPSGASFNRVTSFCRKLCGRTFSEPRNRVRKVDVVSPVSVTRRAAMLGNNPDVAHASVIVLLGNYSGYYSKLSEFEPKPP